ncbi:MAG: DNA-binding protein [Thermoprotei archaeon]|nr:MAG: DNA-binding protein [Thermoprotei archaeon]
MKVAELKPGMNKVDLKVVVVEVSEPRIVRTRYGVAKVADALVKDDTGEVKMSLWNEQISLVSPGDRISIENGYTTQFRGNIQVNVGKYGRIVKT